MNFLFQSFIDLLCQSFMQGNNALTKFWNTCPKKKFHWYSILKIVFYQNLKFINEKC